MPIFTFHLWTLTIAPTWYGLMYALSFLVALFFIQKNFPKKQVDLIFFWTILGVILGGRIGYVLFYNLGYYLDNPLEIFMIWKGGMSFHGWLLGVIGAWMLIARKIQISFLALTDRLVWIVPLWLFFWRIGNYINAELLGFPYDGFGARVRDGVAYFPTPLLEAFLEWIVLFLILFWRKKHIQYSWQVWVWFLGGYGVFRFIAEFFRTPDVQIGYLFNTSWMTMGHVLSLCMIVSSMVLSLLLRKRRQETINDKG